MMKVRFSGFECEKYNKLFSRFSEYCFCFRMLEFIFFLLSLSLTKSDQHSVSTQTYTHAHTAPLQPHPPLPCTYFPSPVVNCIPLDDITGNKRQQQDNKRSELQSTSFISDFITPRLMDFDLYTLLHLTCSITQPPPPPFSHFFSHTLSFSLSVFFQCYL